MRDEGTPAEILVRKYLIDYLDRANGKVIVDPSITDKPEIVFSKNGNKIGCEFVGINIGEFYKYGKSNIGVDHWQSLNYPIEPYFIFNELIKKKLQLFNSYKKRAKTDKIWLLIHDPIISAKKGKGMFIPYSVKQRDYVELWFYFIVEQRPNPFQKILYLRSDRSKQDIIESSFFNKPKPKRDIILKGVSYEIDKKITVRGIDNDGRPRIAKIDLNSPIEKEYYIPMRLNSSIEVIQYLRMNGCILNVHYEKQMNQDKSQ